jgi:hypothetical protein
MSTQQLSLQTQYAVQLQAMQSARLLLEMQGQQLEALYAQKVHVLNSEQGQNPITTQQAQTIIAELHIRFTLLQMQDQQLAVHLWWMGSCPWTCKRSCSTWQGERRLHTGHSNVWEEGDGQHK